MSQRPPYFLPNNSLPPPRNNLSGSTISNINQNPRMINNNYLYRPFAVNNPNQGLTTSNNVYQNNQQLANVGISVTPPHTNNFNKIPICVPPPGRLPITHNQCYPQPTKQTMEHNFNTSTGGKNLCEKSSNFHANSCQKDFSFPHQNTNNNHVHGVINYEGFSNVPYSGQNMLQNPIPNTYQTCPPNALPTPPNIVTFSENAMPSPQIAKNSVIFSEQSAHSLIIPPPVNSVPLQMPTNYIFNVPPPILQVDTSTNFTNYFLSNSSKKTVELTEFISKFSCIKEMKKSQITVPEFRSVLKAGFSLMKLLMDSKSKLLSINNFIKEKPTGDLIQEWNSEVQCASNLKKQLSEICSLINAPIHLNTVMRKLKYIKRKRELKKKTKVNKLAQKIKVEQNREELSQEIDKYLDDIKEKNLKLKREVELKKEADFILLEVRKKIHEAKRTIDKIKAFEKLRNARLANATQKGLYILSDHSEKFEKKIARLKETMLKQLDDYEAEEKALKVMLETEQEGQLEEEAQWKLKKMKTRQQIRKNHIKECLFGNSEDPEPSDPLFLFHKYHTSASDSVENLAQIRRHWDMHLADDGETVPQQWIVPITPSNSSWEKFLVTPVTSKS